MRRALIRKFDKRKFGGRGGKKIRGLKLEKYLPWICGDACCGMGLGTYIFTKIGWMGAKMPRFLRVH